MRDTDGASDHGNTQLGLLLFPLYSHTCWVYAEVERSRVIDLILGLKFKDNCGL